VVSAELAQVQDYECCLNNLLVDIVDAVSFLHQSQPKVIFMDATHDILEKVRLLDTVLFARPEIVGFSKGECIATIPTLGSVRRIILCASTSSVAAACQTRVGASTVRMPYLYKASGMKRFRPNHGLPRVIILGSPQSAGVAVALALAEAWKVRAHLVRPVGEPRCLPVNAAGRISCGYAGDFLDAVVQGNEIRPLFAIDYSGGQPGLQLCREILDSSGVPVLVGRHGSNTSVNSIGGLAGYTEPAAKSPDSPPQSSGTVRSERDLREVFRKFLLDPQSVDRAFFDRSRQQTYGGDAGWAWFWEFCKRLWETGDGLLA
jgi:hypothetical protein